MGLNERLSRYAVRRAHVLVVESPGAWITRVVLEQAMLARGWRPALSPAGADVLAVCGTPGPQLTEVVERLWEQMPGPRVRVDLLDIAAVSATLDVAVEELADTGSHEEDAGSRSAQLNGASSPDGHQGMDQQGMDHGGMGHEDMEMAPGGIPLAEGGGDRDGLEMDVLHLRLGPVLSHWPAGLVLRCALQGDIITEAEGHQVDDLDDAIDPESATPAHGVDGDGPADERTDRATAYLDLGSPDAAWRWDNIARLLALAGWEEASARSRRIRDTQLTTGRAHGSDAPETLHGKLARSRTLRWSLRGLRPLGFADLEEQSLPEYLVGDTYDRLLAMLDRAAQAAESTATDSSQIPGVSPDAAACLVVGLDVAAARLVLASLDMPPLPAPNVVTRG